MSSSARVRRYLTTIETVHEEAGKPVTPPLTRAAVAAVVANPWHGRGFVADLLPDAAAVTPSLAAQLIRRLGHALGGLDRILGYGKAVIVGEAGEAEHGAALLHAPYFAPALREAVGGTSMIIFGEARGGPGTPVSLPTLHVREQMRRDFFQAFTVQLPDAPRADEIALILGGVTGPRPHARSGDRTTDAERYPPPVEDGRACA